ncbi:MAG: 3-isopropylmalate dehydrogenase [Deltaproteobacteria bacterium]|nr:MAG: 3-isopropylmalate dehydrogenase [Deltaproteobacteria bacterium]
MTIRIAVVPGDGIGTEVIPAAVHVLQHLASRHDLALDLVPFDLGAERYLRDGTTMPPEVMERWRTDFQAILLGALGDPRVPGNQHAVDILLGARFQLDLYINLRPVRLLDARYTPLRGKDPSDIDFVVFRENTEGLYTGIGGQFKRGTPDEVTIEAELNTRKGVERIIRAAFAYAQAHGRGSVCMSDKSNAMRHGHDLWRRVFAEVSAEYPQIESFHLYVDALCMELVRAPERFEVIVTNNLFGDIITDLGAQLQGGIGLAASGNINPEGVALFEPVHGSAPDIVGRGIANPLAAILSVGMMLSHFGHADLDAAIQRAVQTCLAQGQVTPELGGELSTDQVTDRVIAHLR